MSPSGGTTPCGGTVASGFEPVADAFARNFTERGELGAAFAVTRDGRPVVDLWGGVADADAGRPWREDTLQLIFSGTKGLVGLCVAMLVERGRLCLDDPVCRHWPEFAVAGKQSITVAEVVSHRACLPGVRVPVGEDELLDHRRMAALVAAQAPERDPRLAFIYHPFTFGWMCSELVRRVDGRTLGRFLAEEVAEPLGLEVWLGLPERFEPRVSTLRCGRDWGQGLVARADAFPGDAVWESIWRNPPLFEAGDLPWNRRAFHAAEIAGANAIGSARSIARLYGALACGGALDGVRLLTADALALATAPLAAGTHPYTGERLAFGIGFELQTADGRFGPAARAFGHSGAGGSVHGAWPEHRVGFSYAMNELRADPAGDPRARALLDALAACLD
ncbi:MAG: serine hydrolase domain-containing protein [Conexibacter sp.]